VWKYHHLELGGFMRRAASVVAFASLFVPLAILAQALPPVRPLGPVLNISSEPLGAVSQVRPLPNGRVIVNDNAGRRVLMFDSTLQDISVVADSTTATANAYSSQLGGLIGYLGDSTLFVDPSSLSMLVIDPNGKIVRTMASPRAGDIQNLIGGPFGTPGFDARGRLVYRIAVAAPRGATVPRGYLPPVVARPDSALIVRFDLASRSLDTVIKIGIPKIRLTVTQTDDNVEILTVVNPMSWTDDWALLSDGTIAVVRGRDYRVEFIGPDDEVRLGPKLAFDWERMTDEDKAAVIDSARSAMDKQRAQMIARMEGASRVAAAGARIDTATTSGSRRLPQGDGMTVSTGRGGGGGVMIPMPPPQGLVNPSELPDYRPVFRQGAARGDADGNLWIRTSKIANGGTVYDVINGSGELTDRVQVPPGRVIAGFGPGGVVYMGVVNGGVIRLERARIR
jgi:hypothetical protein